MSIQTESALGSSISSVPIRKVPTQNPVCPKCQCKNTVKKGKRRNRMQTLQIYECSECLYHFTSGTPGKNKTYPLKVILDAISTFNLGNSLTDTQRIMRQKAHVEIPSRTLQDWLQTYRPLCTYHRLRSAAGRLYPPDTIIRALELEHRQVYRFQVHRAKLDLLLATPDHGVFSPLREYFHQIETNFPHNLGCESPLDESARAGKAIHRIGQPAETNSSGAPSASPAARPTKHPATRSERSSADSRFIRGSGISRNCPA